MTRLSDYLNAEARDPTEPVSFYEPGALDDPEHALAVRRGRRAVQTRYLPLPPVDESETWDGHDE